MQYLIANTFVKALNGNGGAESESLVDFNTKVAMASVVECEALDASTIVV